MTEQIITIGKDGKISGLEHKNGLDLKQFGEADILRTSEVMWDKTTQLWYVEFRHTNPPQILGLDLWCEAAEDLDMVWTCHGDSKIVMFHDYDQGVKAEIVTLNYLRKQNRLLCECGITMQTLQRHEQPPT